MFLGHMGGTVAPVNVKWQLSACDLETALSFMVEGHPWPKQNIGPVTLTFSYDFLWRDPSTGAAFPEQSLDSCGMKDPRSHIRVDLQRTSFISPDLVFPYDLANPRLYDLLNVIIPALPFRAAIKHFLQSLPLKGDSSKRKLKRLDGAGLARLAEFLV